jgi:hypothetical protein
MIYLTKFRKFYIDSILSRMNTKYKGMLMFDLGSGSRDPESDYDLEVKSKDQSLKEVKALE